MLAMAPPVTSRNAAIISSLARQNPISSAAVIVPAKARVNSDTFTITFRLISLSRNDGAPDCCIRFPADLLLDCNLAPRLGNNSYSLRVTGVIRHRPQAFESKAF